MEMMKAAVTSDFVMDETGSTTSSTCFPIVFAKWDISKMPEKSAKCNPTRKAPKLAMITGPKNIGVGSRVIGDAIEIIDSEDEED